MVCLFLVLRERQYLPQGTDYFCRSIPSVKMSNEGLHSAFPRTQIQFGGFRGPSRAIRKIHIDVDLLPVT